MATVCFYFQVHQPFRLCRYNVFNRSPHYFDENANRELMQRIAQKCYLPANQTLLELIREHEGKFRVAFSLSGVVLDQFRNYVPEVIDSYRELARTGAVEFLAETYHHSLSFLYSREEFVEQVELHHNLMRELFDYEPTVFRNTELIYSNEVAQAAEEMGYKVVLCEGADHLLGYRSPAFVYSPPDDINVRLLLKNYRRSDDIAFRFSNRDWVDWPLTADKFAAWVDQVNDSGQLVNLFLDYETFGEHQWAETGIFDFLRHLPKHILELPDNDFLTPSECAQRYESSGVYDVPHMISWADTERDLSAWLGNAMQSNALHEIYRLEPLVKACNDETLLTDWRRLQTSDHYYYMSTKYLADAAVHHYFNPYDSPYDAYINLMNVIDNLKTRVNAALPAPTT